MHSFEFYITLPISNTVAPERFRIFAHELAHLRLCQQFYFYKIEISNSLKERKTKQNAKDFLRMPILLRCRLFCFSFILSLLQTLFIIIIFTWFDREPFHATSIIESTRDRRRCPRFSVCKFLPLSL